MTRDRHEMIQRYALFGMSILSAIDLPELPPLNTADAPEITVEPGEVTIPPRGEAKSSGLMIVGDEAILTVPGVARFAIASGSRITFDAAPGAAPATIRLFLLGSAMGILLHQRGIVPLHANAIDTGEGAIAFLGPSGAGKSTLAAAFHDAGRPILSDDVCALEYSGGNYLALLGVPRLRLWKDALENTGRNPADYEPVLDAVEKFTVATGRVVPARATALRAIYVLANAAAEGRIAIRELSGRHAFEAIVANTYRGSAIEIVGNSRAYFEQCLVLTRSVPVFEFSRPWDAQRLPEAVPVIERHLESLGVAPAARVSSG